jgi:hypothetical protein
MSLFADNVPADIYAGKTRTQTTQKIIYMSFYRRRMMTKWTKQHVQKTIPVHFLYITQILALDYSASAHHITPFTNAYSQLNTEDACQLIRKHGPQLN